LKINKARESFWR